MQNFIFNKETVLGAIRSPVFIGTETLVRHAEKSETLKKVVSVCESLSEDEFTATMIEAYRKGISNFGDAWAYVDITSLLYAVAELGKPENYLEIGVRRGRSSCMVASASPETAIYGFDLWQEDYAKNENPGADFVEAELVRLGHKGRREFIGGDSHKTIPEYFAKHPDLTFDLITVDGDHSLEGAWDDLCNVVGKLRVGGVIVFDDIDNPYCPGLKEVWERFINEFPELSSQIVTNPLGLGVAVAIRMWAPGAGNIQKKSKESWLSKWR